MNRVDIRIDGAEGGHLEIREIRARPALAAHIFELDVLYHLRGRSQERPVSLHGFRGSLSLGAKGELHHVGTAFTPHEVPATILPEYEFDFGVRLWCEVSGQAIEEFERRRNGELVTLHLMIGCVATIQGRAGPVTATVMEPLSKHRWAELLESSGLGVQTWIQVRSISDPADGPRKRASDQFAVATKKLAGGDWMGSIGACRMVAESLLELLPTSNENGGNAPRQPRSKPRAERIRDLAASLRDFAGGAVHGDVIPPSEWGRADAALSVRTAASLLAYADEIGR